MMERLLFLRWPLAVVAAGIFIYAGAIKVIDPQGFLQSLETYHLFPYPLAVAIVAFIPPLEIAAGISLLIPRLYRGAGLLLVSLMSVFIALAALSWARGIEINCGCFKSGGVDPTSYAWIFLRDFAILGLLGALHYLFNFKGKKIAQIK